jgi:hypothetical protein
MNFAMASVVAAPSFAEPPRLPPSLAHSDGAPGVSLAVPLPFARPRSAHNNRLASERGYGAPIPKSVDKQAKLPRPNELACGD